MKFFKHFTDAHRGSSLKILCKKYGMAAVGRYWVFVELCAEKMNKEREEEYTEAHTHFEFEKSYLAASLGFGNLKQASTYLQAISDLGLCCVEDAGDVWACSMPKLLECLDRDTGRARPARGSAAPKIKKKEEDKEEDIDKEINTDWNYEAEICFQAVRKYKSDYHALDWLGDLRGLYIEDLGGISFIRSLKQNSFEAKRLASLIKESWIRIKQNQEGA